MSLQLGLKIVKSLNGFQEIAEINGVTAWTKNVRDTREDCKVIEGLNEDSNSSVIMYTADKIGEYYTIISLIDGRRTDFISAWVFRPWGLEISGKELLSIIEDVRNEILASEISEDKLAKLFSNVYPESESTISPICTEGVSSAARFYNKKGADYSLSEIFAHGMAQKVNKGYKAVFLVDCSMGLTASGCTDISSSKLEQLVSVYPPMPQQLAAANGFIPYLENGEQFQRPISVIIGAEIKVVWKKAGYEDISSRYIVKGDKSPISVPGPESYRKLIPISRFKIVDETGQEISNCRIRIENRDFPQDGYFPISEHASKNALVSVICEGYITHSEKHDLNNWVKIELHHQTHKYKFATVGKNGEKIQFEIISNKVLEHTPFKGYHSEDGHAPRENTVNRIEFRPDGVLAIKKVWTLAAVLLVVGIAIGAFGFWFFDDRFEENTPPVPPKQEFKIDRNATLSQAHTTTLNQAINYLESHDPWKKSEMESIPELQGLWDDLNTFKLEKVKNRSNLLQSNRFNALVERINTLLELTDNRPVFDRDTYVVGDDECITIEHKGASMSYTKILGIKIEKVQNAHRRNEEVKGGVSRGSDSSKKASSKGNPKKTEDNSSKELPAYLND